MHLRMNVFFRGQGYQVVRDATSGIWGRLVLVPVISRVYVERSTCLVYIKIPHLK